MALNKNVFLALTLCFISQSNCKAADNQAEDSISTTVLSRPWRAPRELSYANSVNLFDAKFEARPNANEVVEKTYFFVPVTMLVPTKYLPEVKGQLDLLGMKENEPTVMVIASHKQPRFSAEKLKKILEENKTAVAVECDDMDQETRIEQTLGITAKEEVQYSGKIAYYNLYTDATKDADLIANTKFTAVFAILIGEYNKVLHALKTSAHQKIAMLPPPPRISPPSADVTSPSTSDAAVMKKKKRHSEKARRATVGADNTLSVPADGKKKRRASSSGKRGNNNVKPSTPTEIAGIPLSNLGSLLSKGVEKVVTAEGSSSSTQALASN